MAAVVRRGQMSNNIRKVTAASGKIRVDKMKMRKQYGKAFDYNIHSWNVSLPLHTEQQFMEISKKLYFYHFVISLAWNEYNSIKIRIDYSRNVYFIERILFSSVVVSRMDVVVACA